MTNREMLEFVISSDVASVEINGETVGSKAQAMLKTITKKSTKPKAYEKNAEIRNQIFSYMVEQGEEKTFTASELAKVFDLSTSKVSHIMKELIEIDGVVYKNDMGRNKPYEYGLVSE